MRKLGVADSRCARALEPEVGRRREGRSAQNGVQQKLGAGIRDQVVEVAFLNVNGSSVIDSTTATLFSVGTFSGGSKTVAATDTLTLTYTLSV